MVATPRAQEEEGDAEKMYSRRQRELLESAATGFLSRATRSLDSESPAPPAHWQCEQLFHPRKPASGVPSPRLRHHARPTNEASTTSRVVTKLSSLKRNGWPTGMSCSLDSIMEAYAEHRDTLDRIAIDSGVRNKADTAMTLIASGDKCEVFSTQANDWEDATVIAVDSEKVCVRFTERYSKIENKKHNQYQQHRSSALQPASERGKVNGSTYTSRTVVKWVNQNGSEFRRVGPVARLSDHAKEMAALVRKLTSLEEKRAIQSLMIEPNQRTKESVSHMVAWSYSLDPFYGLTEKQRTVICLEAEVELTMTDSAMIAVGAVVLEASVILEGRCAVYAARNVDVLGNEVLPTQQVDLKQKFRLMQRRASMAVRTDAAAVIRHTDAAVRTSLPPAATMTQRRQSIAAAIAIAGVAKPGPAAAAALQQTGLGVCLEYAKGDGVGLEEACCNCDTAAVEQSGFRTASHTVMCLTPVSRMSISNPEHIRLLQETSRANLRGKVQLLKSLSGYSAYSDTSMELMARHCRREYFQTMDRIVLEGDEPSKVFYVVKGQCRVIKHLNKPGEKTIDVMGRGSCFGDAHAAKQQNHQSSVLAVGIVEVLTMSASNFRATAPQTLLDQLLTVPLSDEGWGTALCAPTASKVQTNPTIGSARFRLITRRDVQAAVERLKTEEPAPSKATAATSQPLRDQLEQMFEREMKSNI